MKSSFTWLVWIAVLAAPLGCKKSESAYPAESAQTGGSYYQEGIAVTEGEASPGTLDMAEREVAADYRWDSPDDTKSPAPVLVPVEPTGGKAEPAEPPTSEPDDDDQPDHGRHMVYTASLQLAVYELDEVIEFAEDIPTRYGGWVQARHDYQITLRVPAARLGEVMAELSTLGVVLGKTLQASDVTAQYTDLESRIAVLEKMLEQLELLLAQAKTVEDSLKVRQELERVRIELEAARTQFRQLAELVGFSTLTLHLSLRGSDQALPSSNDPFPWVDQLGVESTEFR